jgi:hypothetical protein
MAVLAVRPEFPTSARVPPTARSAPRGGEAGASGFDCGAGITIVLGVAPSRWRQRDQ